MAKLLLSREGNVIKEFRLTRPRVLIGRRPGNDIQIAHRAISGVHAAIEKHDGGYVLTDLESTNGTRVNGEPVVRHVLRDGDTIRIGRYHLLFDSAGESPGLDVPSGLARLASGEAPASAVAMGNVATVPTIPERAAPALPPASMRVISGRQTGQVLQLDKPATTLGKAGVQVAMITRQPKGYLLMHVEGERRPLVNGLDLGLHSRVLRNGDVIDLLGVQMAFQLGQ
ncbi:FHA domain-containing protein [Chitinilyticum litopenaei]|uniref:FHA domain-containing protein n=1 Tax=Chitinilyticum litopenaei TaxID=1121276 RepID=UPI0004202622|nr:FHA domain-containing protein [Chitinilyticum litopenaei]